ncbi:MAG: hypothetical protein KY451_07600 [Actinobacteria bacterium]|nr:hypothetical protein [Actinomycetota bacterium]MBW3647145.1 hypothetical protein [Actinomycetota bacterium]
MTWTALGLLYGLFLGTAAAFGGTAEFLTVLVLGAIGLFVGRVLDGAVDLTGYVGGKDRQRP